MLCSRQIFYKHCFSVTRFILNLQQPLRNLPSMFEPFTVITALTVTAATFGILSIISDYCLNYYRLKNKQKKGKFFLNVSPYYVTTLSPQYVDMSYTKCLRYALTLSATMSPQRRWTIIALRNLIFYFWSNIELTWHECSFMSQITNYKEKMLKKNFWDLI